MQRLSYADVRVLANAMRTLNHLFEKIGARGVREEDLERMFSRAQKNKGGEKHAGTDYTSRQAGNDRTPRAR